LAFINNVSAQNNTNNLEPNFTFKLDVDYTDSTKINGYTVNNIKIYSTNDSLYQTINVMPIIDSLDGMITLGNPANHITIEDVNFDGYDDISIPQQTVAYNICGLFWIWDTESRKFIRFNQLDSIPFPTFDNKNKTITSFLKDGCCYHEDNTYKYINGKITLINSLIDDAYNGLRIHKKLENGTLITISSEKFEPKQESSFPEYKSPEKKQE
jgi:hypothetical protein